MTKDEIFNLKVLQEIFFQSGKTLDVRYRIEALRKLYSAVVKYQDELREALHTDLGKSSFEADMCEIRLTLSEISFMLKHVKKYSRTRKVRTNLANFAGPSMSFPSPYGNVLIMSPWNYPVLLTLEPLADALSAGNTAIIKTSAYSPRTSEVISRMIRETFHEEYVAVVTGGREENSSLLDENFDYIFFTGSKSVGKLVMRAAAKHLTPVTLELGGKSPVIVAEDANIKLAARRIVFGKFLNCGQTCVAPDYVLVDSKVHDRLLEELEKQTAKQFGSNPLSNANYGKIINEKHFERLLSLIDKDKVVLGGRSDSSALRIEPTILDNVTTRDRIMKEEIFGPLLPILTFDYLEEAVRIVKSMDHPLAFYVFSDSRSTQRQLVEKIGFGGGCINDTIVHLATSNMGFGGFRESGMGQYHGKAGFETFTHYKSIYRKANWLDLPMRYQPYNELMHKLINFILR